MKKLITSFIFLGLSFCFSQEKIDGIGIFKINKTTTSVIDTLKNNGFLNTDDLINLINEKKSIEYNKLSKKEKEQKKKDSIENSKYDFISRTIPNYNLEDEIEKLNPKRFLIGKNYNINYYKTYTIYNYTVADIEIKLLHLYFLNDLLFKIEIYFPETKLTDALDIKYPHQLDIESKKINCSSIYGDFDREEKIWTTTYRYDEIKSIFIFENLYDDKCKSYSNSFFYIYDTVKNKSVDDIIKIKTEKND